MQGGSYQATVAKQANSPEANERVCVANGFLGELGRKAATVVDGPEALESKLAIALEHEAGETRHEGGIAPIGEQTLSCLAVPFVGVLQKLDQLRTGFLGEVKRFYRLGALGMHAIDAAAALVPSIARIEVTKAAVVPVGKIHRAIGAGLGVDNAKPAIVRGGHRWRVNGAKARGVLINSTCLNAVHQCHAGDDVAFVTGQFAALVDDGRLREARLVALMRHVLIETKRMRIYQRPMFGPALDVATALYVMHPARVAIIRAAKCAALAVEIHAKRIATALGKYFEFFCARMIPPNRLSEELDALNLRRARAAMRAINPTVRSPAETVCTGVSVLKAEATQVHFRIAIRNVIAVSVRIK